MNFRGNVLVFVCSNGYEDLQNIGVDIAEHLLITVTLQDRPG